MNVEVGERIDKAIDALDRGEAAQHLLVAFVALREDDDIRLGPGPFDEELSRFAEALDARRAGA